MKSYRTAFFFALTACLVLAAALGLAEWDRLRGALSRISTMPAVPAAPGASLAALPAAPVSVEPPLAPVQISPERLQSIGIRTGEVQVKSLRSEIRTVGDVEMDERRLAYVQLRFPGWIQKVYANSTYQYIEQGQPLFTVYSPDLVATEQEYLLAKRHQATLGASSVSGVAAGSASLLDAALERLRRWQIPAREIEQLEATGQARQELEVDSPVSGFITERNALPNQYVQPETRLYSVADLSTVWVYAAIFQNDLARLHAGDVAAVTSDAFPGRTFIGRVDYIWPQVDLATRTARVRLVFPNPGLKLKPGMYVNVAIGIALGRHLAVPASGVLQTGTRAVVFVDHGGGSLEPREVQLGQQAGDDYIVLKGLAAGERIITSANFLVDSESQLQAAMGSFVPPPGAGAAASVNAPATQPAAQVEFSTDPATPRKGANVYRVKLTAAGGSPVTGAQVSVRSFMPAMPAMGMAAMNVSTPLLEKGGGVYEGPVSLESGGTWQIAVTATRNGAVVATRQLSLNVEGGMQP
ncbi:MAG TPA: efflux RND transporter periplasmic adaptor subunit [Candidatus Acidoferrales bacterium]|nr:efflux RND transporter periplasmic adaptor subunit [Candidatus Acidoferrales bacterium]